MRLDSNLSAADGSVEWMYIAESPAENVINVTRDTE